MKRASATLALVALLALPPALEAQSGPHDNLNVVFRSISTTWARDNASGLARFLSPRGVSIDVSDGPMGPLGERQAVALLRQVFDQGETMAVHAGMLERVGGSPPRAFGAITWVVLPVGTQLPVRRTVYFGLELDDEGWRISEIRLIR